MTVADMYDQTIKSLPAGDRLRLARLILDDLSPEEPLDNTVPEREGGIRDSEHLEELLLAGLNSGRGVETSGEYWNDKRAALIERHGANVGSG